MSVFVQALVTGWGQLGRWNCKEFESVRDRTSVSVCEGGEYVSVLL
jgi:hypothetical protein